MIKPERPIYKSLSRLCQAAAKGKRKKVHMHLTPRPLVPFSAFHPYCTFTLTSVVICSLPAVPVTVTP